MKFGAWPPGLADVKFAFIRDNRGQFPVEAHCDVMDVSRSGFYAWDRRPDCSTRKVQYNNTLGESKELVSSSKNAKFKVQYPGRAGEKQKSSDGEYEKSPMRWTEQVIAAHKNSLAQRTADRRSTLTALWEQYRTDGMPKPVVEMSLELVSQGNANEVELGFSVLMDLALSDDSLLCHVSELAKHKSATVRRNLAFYLSRQLPSEFSCSVFAKLLRDKAASVRIRAIESIGMRDWKTMLPALHALRANERSDKVIQSLEYWIPLLEAGYRVGPSQVPGCFEVTALTGRGTASRIVEASSPDDPRIRAVVEELRRFP